MVHIKLNRLKSIVNQALRSSAGNGIKYFQDPFYHYSPEFEIKIDLLTGILIPDMEGDDVEKYYKVISNWFHEVLPKEGIPLGVIEKAVIKLTPEGKECIIIAENREFRAFVKY